MATKTKIYLVMELAKGGELLLKIARCGRLSEAAARRYFQQLVSALHFCHENGVTHRDVKPQNILLDQDGNLKVSDFGLSALPEQLKDGLLHTACGTPAYTAPEVIGRRGGYEGSKADAWSCGVILYVFLAGHLPFDDTNLVGMYKKIYKRDYQFPAWFTKPARSIISKLLDPNPDTRLSIEALMEVAWFKKSLQLKRQFSLLDLDLIPNKDPKFDSFSGSAPIMNAFDIISLSSGLDLSGLFEAASKRERRFTSTASAKVIVEKVKEAGGKLGFSVEEGKGGTILGLRKGRIVVLVEVLEVAASLLLVEVKVVGGGGMEFEERYWGDLKAGLEGIVLSWHNDVM